MERDFSQIVPRPVRDEYGETLESMLVGNGDYLVEMTRTGWNNPAKRTRSNLQRVAYEIEDNVLLRHFWLVLDRAEDSEPVTQELLEGVEDFRVNLLTEDGEGIDSWPESEEQQSLPLAVEVIIQSEGLGEVRRVFVLASSAVPVNREGGPGDNNEAPGNPGDTPIGAPGVEPLGPEPRVLRN
jgi:general secretion pathway protein J